VSVARHYRAFISYSHADARIAAWLHRSLENYRVPQRLHGKPGEYGAIPERLTPIFRDREELASSGDLAARVQEALAQTEALVVICSPDAARSPWVDKEILAFKRLGRGARIYCLIVAGEPHAGDARECFPPSLRYELEADGTLGQRPAEPIAADLRPGKDGRNLARLKLIAGLLGTNLDDLRRREAQRKQRRLFAIAMASLAAFAIALFLAVTAWVARNDALRRQAQAEGLLDFMLVDLKKKLDQAGRLDLLDSVYDKATAHFATLDPRDLSDTTLAQQAQTLTQIGSLRLNQARYPEAIAGFRNAYARTRVLAQRHADDGQILFDRGQAEYWIGFVYWQSRDLNHAREWLTRYRDTCRAVYAIDPTKEEWVHELAYGDHNLAVLDLERGDLVAARNGFDQAQSIQRTLLARKPGDGDLTLEIADEISWQANIAAQLGQLDRASALFADEVESLRKLAAAQPGDLRWPDNWSTSELLLSDMLRLRGRFADAEAHADSAAERLQKLVAHDPANKDWSHDYARALALRAAARIGAGRADAANADLALAQPLLDAEAKVADADRLARRDLLDALALRIQWLLRSGDIAGARADAKRLSELHAKNAHRDTAEEIGSYAQSEWLTAVADAGGTLPVADDAHLLAARTALAPLAASSRYWRVLDPWLRIALARGDAAEATRVRKLLDDAGYVPLFAWPAASAATAQSSTAASR
jgi:hypothetical protein